MTPFTWHNYTNRRWQDQHLQPKVADLLLILHLRAGHVVSMEDMIVFLWPDADLEPDSSFDLVRQYVGRIRNIYGRELIRTVWGRGYALNRQETRR